MEFIPAACESRLGVIVLCELFRAREAALHVCIVLPDPAYKVDQRQVETIEAKGTRLKLFYSH